MFRSTIFLISCLLAYYKVNAASELSVNVYEGPTECEESIQSGYHISMRYTGTIDQSSKTGEPGKQFDAWLEDDGAFELQIGMGNVIKGWDEGLLGLCKGAKATLIVPPHMGYGDIGAGDGVIPGGATLNFDVEVVDFTEFKTEPNLFLEIDTDGDGKISRDEGIAFYKKSGSEMTDDFFDGEDTDKDGFISWEEFDGPKGDEQGGEGVAKELEEVDDIEAEPEPNLFIEIDMDGNGKISRDEAIAFFVKNGDPEMPDDFFDGEDTDKDGFISWDEFTGPKGDELPVRVDESEQQGDEL